MRRRVEIVKGKDVIKIDRPRDVCEGKAESNTNKEIFFGIIERSVSCVRMPAKIQLLDRTDYV